MRYVSKPPVYSYATVSSSFTCLPLEVSLNEILAQLLVHLFFINGDFRRLMAIASERFDEAVEGMKSLIYKGSRGNDL